GAEVICRRFYCIFGSFRRRERTRSSSRLEISRKLSDSGVSLPGQWKALYPPVADAAIHGDGIAVPHLLQIVRGQGRAKSSSAVEDEGGCCVGHALLNVALDNPFAQVNRARQVVFGPFTLLPDVYENKFFAAVELGFYCVDVGFFHAFLGLIHQL